MHKVMYWQEQYHEEMKIMIIIVVTTIVLNLYFGIVVYQNQSFRQRSVLEILPNSYYGQQQPSRGVLKKRCSENMEQI